MAAGVVSELAVLFKADTSALERGMKDARRATDDAGDAAEKSGAKFGTMSKVIGGVALAATAAAVGLGAAAINLGMKFDATLSELGAVSGASVDVMDELRSKALQIGKDTAFSAGEAANALVELSKAGLSTEKILGGAADATVALAAAGGIDIPQAATIASAAMNQFGLAAADLPKVADLLAGAANASATDVAALGESLSNVGATAKLVGMDIGDTTTALAALANIGITGGEAGSTLNRALLSLASPTTDATALMNKLGFSAFDATGKLKPLPELAGGLNKALGDLDPAAKAKALETMFSSFGMKAGAALFEAGAEGINSIADAMGKVSAQDVAKAKLDNLAGSITMMKGSLETFGIMAASAFQPMIKGAVDAATGVINAMMPMAEAGGKAIEAFGEGFNADFKGADFLDRMSLGFGNLAKSLPEGPVKSLAGWLSKLVDPFKGETALEKFAGKVGELMAAAGERVGAAFDMVRGALATVATAIGNVDWSGILGRLVEGFNNARPGIEAFIAAVVDRFTYFKDEILPPVIAFITGTLIPAFADFGKRAADGFAIIAPFVTMAAAKFMEFGNVVIESVWPIVKKVFDFIGEHSGVFVTIGAVIAVLAGGPITMLIGALALIGTIVPSVIEWFESVKAKVAEMSDAIGARVTEIAAWWQNVKDSTAAAWQAVKDGVAAAVQFVLDWIKEKFQAAKDFIKSIHDAIKDAIMRVWLAIPADIRARLVEIYNNVVTQFEAVRTAIVVKWEAIKAAISDAITSITDWIKGQAQLMYDFYIQPFIDLGVAIAAKFDEIKAIVVDKVSAFIEPIRAKWNEIKAAVVDKVTEIVDGVRTKFAEFKAAITDRLTEAKTAAGNKASEILAALLNPFKNIFADITRVGADLLAGLRKGISDNWTAFKDWFWNKMRSIVGIARETTDSHSPSLEFVRLGEDIVAGLRIGLVGLKDIAVIIQEVFTGMIGSADVENFEMIHRLTSSLLGIFQDAADGIRSLLSFDIVTTTDQIKAAFGRLVDVFMVAVGQMAELSKAAGQGTKPGNEGFINLDHINNIERFTGAIQNTLNVAAGTVDILEKLAKLTLPGAGAITALVPFLQEIANAAAVFEKPLGQDEDAIAVFERGSIVAGHIAAFAKNVADLTSVKFGAVSAKFADEVKAAAVAAGQAWDAVKVVAEFWGDKLSMERDKLIVGVKAYAEVVGAAVSILKGAGELDFTKASFATAVQLGKAADVAEMAAGELFRIAEWWTKEAPEKWERILEGMKLYADAAGAAVSILGAAAGLDLSKMVKVTFDQLTHAADTSEMAAGELFRIAEWWTKGPREHWTRILEGMKDYADAAGAAIGILGASGALDLSKAVKVTADQIEAAANLSRDALAAIRTLAKEYIEMGAEAAGPLVAGVKAFADGAGAAIDLLVKGAGGINALGEIKSLAGVQPGLIRAVLGNLKLALDTVLANLPTFKPEQLARLKDMGDMAGVFDPLAKAATGINALGAIKSLAGVQPRMIRAILGGVNLAVKEVSAGAGTFEDGAVAKVKAWGEASAATLGALTTAADGLTKLGGKITIPEDLSARVAMLVSAMRTVVQGMAAALSGDGAISVDVAKAGADVAEAVGRIGEAFAPIFDAINAALASPFGRIKAKGAKGDTWRQNIADRIKASLVAAVTALSEALATMPTIDVPDALVTGVEKLATVYDRILDILGKLDGIKIDAKALAALAAVPGILAGGLTSMNVTGSGGTLTMSGGASGGGITINNTVTPTFAPMPVTINNTVTAPITVGPRVVQAIAVEVVNQFDTEIKLKPSGP